MSTGWIPPGGFFTDPDLDFEARINLGAAGTGIGDLGLVLATLDTIPDGDRQAWFDAWTTRAGTLASQGNQAVTDGHLETGRWALLAAAEYYAKALVVVDALAGQSVLLPTFREHRACWEAYIDASQGCHVRVAVPYAGTSLPGYLLRPDVSGAPRPTFVMTNGSDGSLPGMLGYGGTEALSRGWNVFLYDGPGQQSMLFERGVPFRYDWEAVLTGHGVSQGGYWIIRAAAFEHRLAAAVADPGVVDVSTSWTELLHTGQKDAFNQAMAPVRDNPEMARTRRTSSSGPGSPSRSTTCCRARRRSSSSRGNRAPAATASRSAGT